MPPKAWPPPKHTGARRNHQRGRNPNRSSSKPVTGDPGVVGDVSNLSSRQATSMVHQENSDKEEGEVTEDEGPGTQSTDGPGSDALSDQLWKAKRFIRAWHDNGYTLTDLINEGLNPDVLRDIYNQLGIDPVVHGDPSTRQDAPQHANPSSMNKAHGEAQTHEADRSHANTNNMTEHKATSDADRAVSSTLPITQTRPQSFTTQREDYIARLKAAKSSKATARQEGISPLDNSSNLLSSVPATSVQPTSLKSMEGDQAQKTSSTVNPSLPSISIPPKVITPPSVPPKAVTPPSVSSTANTSAAHITNTNQKPPLIQKGAGDNELARLRLRALQSARAALAAKNARGSLANGPTNLPTKPSLDKPADQNNVAQSTTAQRTTAQNTTEQNTTEQSTTAQSTAARGTPKMSTATPSPAAQNQPSTAFDSEKSVFMLTTGVSPNSSESTPQPEILEVVDSNNSTTKSLNLAQPNDQQTASTGTTHALLMNRIPGLFMTSPPQDSNNALRDDEETNATPLSVFLSQNQSLIAKRKRPVAADFEDDSSTPITKKMFGHPRGHPYDEDVVIEVSEDEDEPNEIGEQDTHTEDGSQLSAMQQHLKHHLSADGSSIPTPVGGNQSPSGNQNTSPNLKSREAQILFMKRKIAEMELKRKAKSQASGVTTPATPIAQQDLKTPAEPSTPVTQESLDSTALTSAPGISDNTSHQLLHDNASMSIINAKPSVEHNAAAEPLEKGAQYASAFTATSRADDNAVQLLAWKKKRRLEIEAGLPVLSASLTSRQSKLEMLKAQMEEVEATMHREAEERQKLLEELQSLGVDTEGKSIDELKVARQEQLGPTDQHRIVDESTHSSAGSPLASPLRKEDGIQEVSQTTGVLNARDRGTSRGIDNVMVLPISAREIAHPGRVELQSREHLPQTSGIEAELATSAFGLSKAPQSSATANDVCLEPSTPDVDTSEVSDENNIDYDGGTYSPDAPHGHSQLEQGSLASSVSEINGVVVEAVMDNVSDENAETSGEVSESVGDEELPHSALHEERSSSSAEESDGDEWLPDATLSVTDAKVAEDEAVVGSESSYEPPDAASSPSRPKSSPHQSEMQSPTSVAFSVVDESASPGDTNTDSEAVGHAPEPQTGSALDSASAEMVSSKATDARHSYFTPYESPLARFRAYRFHPDFTRNVTSGIRSSTYSHSIDPEKPICAYETAGGTCNDSSCTGQHFRGMAITGRRPPVADHEVLRQLGTAIPAELTQAQRQDYVNGLSEVVGGLRARNIQDADQVAAEIFSYRRRFLDDPTKVLNL